jgi:ABC-type Fe3+ transport system substrate-binding protein
MSVNRIGIIATAWLVFAANAARALTNEEIALYKGADRAQIMLDGAKKEGKVVFYSALNVELTMRPIQAAFEKKYPGVKLETWRGDSPEIVQKVMAERQGRNQVADAIEAGSVAVSAIKGGAVQPFYSPSVAEFLPQHQDPQGMWAPTRFVYYGLAYNTRQVTAAEAPKTFDDLLNPKWKGKMVWVASLDSAAPLFAQNVMRTMGEKAGDEYLKKLAKQDITPSGSGLTATVDRVAQGEYAIMLAATVHTPLNLAKQKGAPLDVSMLEPVPGIVNTIHLIKGAPHPYAAMLFIDYLTSQEGQTTLNNTGYLAAHPAVDPEPHLHKVVPRLAGLKEWFVTPEELFDMRESSFKLIEKYFP